MDIDPSNPLALIMAFFVLMITALMFIVKFAVIGVAGGLIGSMVAIVGGTVVWATNFKGK